MNKERLQYLLEQWIDRRITPEDGEELAGYLELYLEGGVVSELIQLLIDHTGAEDVPSMADRERRLRAILEIDRTVYKKANGREAICPMKYPNHPLRTPFRRWGWVAASILLFIAEGAAVTLAVVANREEQHIITQDIVPGNSNAVLILGKDITARMDSTGNRMESRRLFIAP
jgi:hypothetical protein